MLKIYLSNYASLRANIKISFNSLSTQQLRNMPGTGEGWPRILNLLGVDTHGYWQLQVSLPVWLPP